MGETEGRVQRPGQGLSGIGKNQDCGGSTLHHTAPSSLRQQAAGPGFGCPFCRSFPTGPRLAELHHFGACWLLGCLHGRCVWGGCQEERLGKWGGWEILSEGCLAPRAEADSEACVYPTPLGSPRLTVPRLQEN